MDQYVIYLIMTGFFGSLIPLFYFICIRPIANSHYQNIDADIETGILSKTLTREQVKKWGFEKLHVYLDEQQISETMEYITTGKKYGIFSKQPNNRRINNEAQY